MVEIILPIANKLDAMLGLKANVKFLSVLTSFFKAEGYLDSAKNSGTWWHGLQAKSLGLSNFWFGYLVF